MLQATYTAALGISSQQKRLDNIANNLSNVNTNGFKSSSVSFKDALYNTILRPTQPQGDVNLRLGHGTLVAGTTKSFEQGKYIETGNANDVYIEGEGFFSVLSPQGERLYTRDGSFTKSVEANGDYLTTRSGSYVLDTAGNKIKLQGTSFDVSKEGFVSADGGAPYAQIGLFNFNNKAGLDAFENNLYRQSDASGNPVLIQANQVTMKQKAIEGSNVDVSKEFTKLIRTQRIFSLSSKALTQADQMDGVAVQLR